MSHRRYTDFSYPSKRPGNTLLTGVRRMSGDDSRVLISGFFEPNEGRTRSFVYLGPLNSVFAKDRRNFHELDFPSGEGRTVVSTQIYGPSTGSVKGSIDVVGNFTTEEQPGVTFGCLYQGPLDGSGVWRQLMPPGATQVIAHSNMKDFAVGNYITDRPRAFLYNIRTLEYLEIDSEAFLGRKFRFENASTTAYGIWYNGGDRYTICGGFVSEMMPELERSYLLDWNAATRKFSNFRIFTYNNKATAITHFDGITGDGCGGYYLVGDYIKITGGLENAFFAHIDKKGKQHWETLQVPGGGTTSGNTVVDRTAIGVYTAPNGEIRGYLSSPRFKKQ